MLHRLVEEAAWGDLRSPDPPQWYSGERGPRGLQSAVWLWTVIRSPALVFRPLRGWRVPFWLGSVTQVPQCLLLSHHVWGADSNGFQEFYSCSASNLLLHVTFKVERQRDRNANAPEGPSCVQMRWVSPLIITAKKLSNWGEIEQPRHAEGWTAATSARRCPSRLDWRLSLINLTVLNLQRNWVKMSGWIQRCLIHLYNDSLAKSSSRAGPVFMHDWPALENFKKAYFLFCVCTFLGGVNLRKEYFTLSKGQIKASDVIQTSVTYINVNISTAETKEVYMCFFLDCFVKYHREWWNLRMVGLYHRIIIRAPLIIWLAVSLAKYMDMGIPQRGQISRKIAFLNPQKHKKKHGGSN